MGIFFAERTLMRGWAFLLFLAPIPAFADTVILKDGERIVGKAVRYGEFLIVAPERAPEHPRILADLMVEAVRPEPPTALEHFLDLPPDGDAEPDLQHVRFYPSAKGKVRHLLDLATRKIRSDHPEETRARAREALEVMGKPAEEELFACVVHDPPGGNEERVVLALACLRNASPKGIGKRLTELALLSDGDRIWKAAAEEIRRRSGKTPPEALKLLREPGNNWRGIRAAADLVGVVRDPEGVSALLKAILTKGIRDAEIPRIPYVTGKAELDTPGGMLPLDKGGRIQLVRIAWLDEEVHLKEPEERVLYHLVSVLEGISGQRFRTLQDVEDWRGRQPRPPEGEAR